MENINEQKRMVNYEKGKIYKMVNNKDAQVYIGSTTHSLASRKGKHKFNAKSEKLKNQMNYSHWNMIGWEHVDIILLENYPCKSKEELHARERYWIEREKPCLNLQLPTRSQEEYLETNKEYFLKFQREYYQTHKDEILAKQRIRIPCSCGRTFRSNHRSRHEATHIHKAIYPRGQKFRKNRKNCPLILLKSENSR